MTVATIERIGSPAIPRHQARQAFLDYRRGLALDPTNTEYAALMRGYKAIAAGQSVIDLHKTMQVAGVQHDSLYPRLAICRATARTCLVTMESNGSAVFVDEAYRWRRAPRQRVTLPIGTFPLYRLLWRDGKHERSRPEGGIEREHWRTQATAIVPIVPAALRPRAALAQYHILWDAVWTAAPPADPLLVRHLAGALYAIVAHWDLSPLEQAVLRGRIAR